MSLLVNALEIYTPEFVKKMALAQLFQATADAFGLQTPRLAGLNSKKSLAVYARFVQLHAEERLRDTRGIDALSERLYQNACAMVRWLYKWLGLHTVQDVMLTARMIYRILDIDLQGDVQGDVVIQRDRKSVV